MNLSRVFEYREDGEFGNMGWVPKGAPKCFNTGGGILVAHDILEHTPNTTSSWEDELIALGAMIFIRGETGYFSKNRHNPKWVTHLASDLSMCMEFVKYSEKTIKPLMTKRIESIESELTEAIDQGVCDFKDNNGDQDYKEVAISKATKDSMRSWLRTGYRYAKKRYNDDAGSALYLFNLIQSEVDKITQYAEEGYTEIKVSVSIENRTVDISIIEPSY